MITAPPTLLIAPSATSAALAITANGTTPLSYQWYRGATEDTAAPVPGATGPLLVTPALTATTAFWVRVQNSAGSADSQSPPVTIAPQANLTLYGMGDTYGGELGIGVLGYVSPPVQTITGVASASAGGHHTLFIKTDGSLWAMGYNYSGQIGDGSTIFPSTYVQVATDVASAGYNRSLFIKTDGSLWILGRISYYRHGYGLDRNSSTPVKIATGATSVTSVGARTLFLQNISGQIVSAYAIWAATNGLAGGAADATADPDTDGTPSLLEYLFNTSPTLANSDPTNPLLEFQTIDDQPFLALTHRHRKDASPTVVHQKSTDLANPEGWTPLTLTPALVKLGFNDGGPFELVTISVPLPSGTDPRLFLRLSVSE